MSRIKIQLPKKELFQTKLTVAISDINYGGHLGNDKVLSMVHEARFRWLRSLGYKDEISIDGVGTIQVDTGIQYKGEAFHGDEILITIYLGDTTARSMDLYYHLTCKTKEIARVKTGIAFFDYTERKVTMMPDAFREKVM
ncbi:acyl-CoA thioesterase FadM [Roseivirga pacifica]|uniref:Acyl-CoA thioesterase FadM n=1 Tax=Roseivirga pacifica TaxID=1267423 RepID=A0A1I0NBZ7_9BACT|nr:thioesterase family protein [Roseivirga pacifica]RKQ51070.1 acyl-CoA thioesterase FadM [Roseivirga pacifica]SEV98596.1 Acyl-CoA thioesterase FadM [Roseivirga pacifica]